MAANERQRMVLQTAIEDWDIHVGGCAVCLSEGQNLCDEGAEVFDRVAAARSKLDAAVRSEADEAAGIRTGWHLRSSLHSVTVRSR